jgi:hypothetical protein
LAVESPVRVMDENLDLNIDETYKAIRLVLIYKMTNRLRSELLLYIACQDRKELFVSSKRMPKKKLNEE